MKKYILIAGVNGAGKSTLYQILESLKGMPRVNTDEIVREIGDWRNFRDVTSAGKIAINKVKDFFEQGISFNQETTLCGKSIIKNIHRAKKMGYAIELHYVGVESVEIAKERIAYRVQKGGHGIPDKDVERRYVESMKSLKEVIAYCDLVIMYDNTDKFKRFAIYKNGEIQKIASDTPEWYNIIKE